MYRDKKDVITMCLSAMLIIAPSLGIAAESTSTQLSPIIVTAEKKSENIQEIPVSVTAFSDQKIEDAGITTIQDIARLTPNLFIANWGIRGNSFVFTRGIGAIVNDPAIGFYIDDVNYMDSRVFDTPLFDIERIEVLRGPQGTLYGRSTLGGVINIITKKPTNTKSYGFSFDAGNENLWGATVYLRTPVVEDRLFLGLSGGWEQRDGFYQNDFLRSDVDDRKNFQGRLQLRWLPSSDLDITAAISGESIDDGVFPLTDINSAKTNPYHIAYDHEGRNERDGLGSSLRISWDMPLGNLTSITAYRKYNDEVDNDQDFMPLEIMTAREKIDDRQLTQEFRLSSPDNQGMFQWITGAYLYKRDQDHLLDLNFSSIAASMDIVPMPLTTVADAEKETTGWAVFGQGTVSFLEKFRFVAGLRYEREENSIDRDYQMISGGMEIPGMGNHLNASREKGVFLPKIQLSYQVNPQIMLYASTARGYRSGGFNTDFTDMADLAFDPEYSWNYETGIKSSWLDNRLIANAAFFYIDLEDQQVTNVLSSASTVIRNAGESKSTGFELEGSALVAKGLTVDGSFGYTRSEYRTYFDKITGVDYAGNSTPLAPEYTWNLGIQYTLPLMESFPFPGKTEPLFWITRADIRGVGKFYWDDANTLSQEPYELVSLRTGVETENFSLTFWAKNLFDEQYNAIAFAFAGSSAIAQTGDPRQIGVSLKFRF